MIARAEVERILSEQPNIAASAMAAKLNCTPKYAAQLMRSLRPPKVAKPASTLAALEQRLDLPDQGLKIIVTLADQFQKQPTAYLLNQILAGPQSFRRIVNYGYIYSQCRVAARKNIRPDPQFSRRLRARILALKLSLPEWFDAKN